MTWGVFEEHADRYDAWFDSPEGREIFEAEVKCLDTLLPRARFGWVEVGVGSGRFAEALRIRKGLDPSPEMLRRAERRGIATRQGTAESLPYDDSSLDGILLAVTLCFLDEPKEALRDCARILKVSGQLLVGLVPANSSWGEFYRQKGKRGHPFYSEARFYTCEHTKSLAESAGFEFAGAASTLASKPATGYTDITVAEGAREDYGFVGMLFTTHAE